MGMSDEFERECECEAAGEAVLLRGGGGPHGTHHTIDTGHLSKLIIPLNFIFRAKVENKIYDF